MKRLRRILLNALTVLSLVLFVASVALWTWSDRQPRSWYVQRISRQDPQYVHLWAYSAHGILRLHTARSKMSASTSRIS